MRICNEPGIDEFLQLFDQLASRGGSLVLFMVSCVLYLQHLAFFELGVCILVAKASFFLAVVYTLRHTLWSAWRQPRLHVVGVIALLQTNLK